MVSTLMSLTCAAIIDASRAVFINSKINKQTPMNILHGDRMDMFIRNLDVLGGGAVVQSDANDTTIANIVT